MNYEKLIKQAVEKRKVEQEVKQKEQKEELTNYLTKIKLLQPKIQRLLTVERLLKENKFDYDKLCTDSYSHKVGFAVGTKCIGIYGGGACGNYNLLVDEFGVPTMEGKNDTRNVTYDDRRFLQRFINEFGEFECRVEKFVKSL